MVANLKFVITERDRNMSFTKCSSTLLGTLKYQTAYCDIPSVKWRFEIVWILTNYQRDLVKLIKNKQISVDQFSNLAWKHNQKQKLRVNLHVVQDICPEFENGRSADRTRRLPWSGIVCGAERGKSGHRFEQSDPRGAPVVIGWQCRLRHLSVGTASGNLPSQLPLLRKKELYYYCVGLGMLAQCVPPSKR